MKNIINAGITILLLLAGAGCEKFLEESSQNEVRPSSVVDLEQLMTGEVYPVGTTFHNYLDLLTDDVESTFYNSSMVPGFIKRWEPVFTWQADMYELLDVSGAIGNPGVRVDTYEHYYTRVKGCNVILDMLDKVRGDDASKANLKGQALGMRAWFYFMLVNLYGRPYNAPGGDPATSPGVPLIISAGVKDEPPPRATVEEVYRQVEADLLEALPLLQQHGQANSKYKVTDMFINALLSRVYLYKEDWEKARQYASAGLAKNATLANLANYVAAAAVGSYTDGPYGLTSPEAIWYGYGTDDEYVSFDWTGFYRFQTYRLSADLRLLYEYQNDPDNRLDMRYRYYFTWAATIQTYPSQAITLGTKRSATATASSRAVKGMRVAELYL
ncbi:MAG: RagB/SusD family nutrient uptake outer membrane protein, partial [Odoribacteraceae bacterium]|nr:RagB/SusD family nutrient uptake outer membrane protein [Odoribacteraceae bacterium]